MRSEEEIKAQLDLSWKLISEARMESDSRAEDAIHAHISALQWVLGIDQSKEIFF